MKKYYIPPNSPPPLTIEQCTTRRTQKDSFDVESTAKPLTFDDIESALEFHNEHVKAIQQILFLQHL